MAFSVAMLRSAQREYEDIVGYLSDVLQSPAAARGFADEFDHQLDLVRDNPRLYGLSRMPELAARGYRAFFVKRYIVLYKVSDGRVVVAHIFHQTQDYARLV